MNRDQIKGDWHQLSRLKEKRKKLTDAGLKGVAGKRDELEGILVERLSLALPLKRADGERHVTLNGTVQYAHQKSAAISAISGMSGVRRVVERMMVTQPLNALHAKPAMKGTA